MVKTKQNATSEINVMLKDSVESVSDVIIEPGQKELLTFVRGGDIPSVLGRMMGCENCSWKFTSQCPVFRQEFKFADMTEKICEDKKQSLREFSTIYDLDNPPSIDRWMLDYQLKYLGMPLLNKLASDVAYAQEDLENARLACKHLEEEGAEEDLLLKAIKRVRVAEKYYDFAHMRYEKTNATIAHHHSNAVQRETVKKVDVRNVRVTPGDMVEMIKRNKEQN